MKSYKMSFNIVSLIIFLAVMIPNFIWFAIPAPNDLLRNESQTELLDMIAAVFQIIMLVALCLVKNKNAGKMRLSVLNFFAMIFYVAYVTGWILYYNGVVTGAVILVLCVAPCLVFEYHAIDRKNYIAVIPITIFMICHVLYGIINFIK